MDVPPRAADKSMNNQQMNSVPLEASTSGLLHTQQQYHPRFLPSVSGDSRAFSDSHNVSKTEKDALDFTQRLERKLAEYSTSQNLIKRWLFEILSWCVSALCMAAVVGIYMQLKDAPLYGHSSGLLLTLANVFGKVASAALIVPTTEAIGQLKWNWFHNSQAMWDFEIFDKASRGPLGAVMLLFRTKGRSLAALGALLIVLLLGIDTFFQQVVDFPDRWSLQDSIGTLPRAVRYIPGISKEYRDGVPVAIRDPGLFQVVEKFSYGNGTQLLPFGNATRPDIPLSCPTSKCTWPVYDTLGVCSQCTDISSHLTYACTTTLVDWSSELKGGWHATEKYPNATMCGFFLNSTSDQPVLMSGHLLGSNGTNLTEVLIMRTLPLTSLTTRVPLFGNGSIEFKHLRNTIMDVLIVSAESGTVDSVLRRVPPIAQECVLSWCVKTIRSSYNYGVYEEEIIEEHLNTTAGPFPWAAYPFEDDLGSGTDIFYLQDISISGTSFDGRQFEDYGTLNNTALSVIQGFIDIFPSFTTTNNTSSTPVMRYKTGYEGPAYNRMVDFNPWLAPNNVSIHMERLATAMTNVVRSAASKTVVKGNAYTRETYISVHWQWLAFPFVLLFLSLVFLILTILKTSNDGEIGIWKTSAMPTLISSLPQDVQKDLLHMEKDAHASRKGARKVRIKLLPDQGWRVSRRFRTSPIERGRDHNRLSGWI